MHARRFALPHKQQLLGVPAGQHIKVRVASKGCDIQQAFCTKANTLEQAFSPISTDDTPGEVALLVKVSYLTIPGQPHRPVPVLLHCALHANVRPRSARTDKV
jgi:hypothetical protein